MRHAAAIALIMLLPVGATMADVYRSVDAQGHVQYSDTPTPGAELIHTQRLGINATASGASNAPVPGSPAPPKISAPPPIQDPVAQKAVQQDVAQSHEDQCKKATADYEQSVQARRIYKTGANGEREYLSDADVEQQRLSLHQAMESLCGSS
jgi:hypothetical protein